MKFFYNVGTWLCSNYAYFPNISGVCVHLWFFYRVTDWDKGDRVFFSGPRL